MLGAGGRSAGALCTDARRLYVDELGDARTANAVGAATGNSTHASSMETRACYHMHLNDFIALDAVIDSSAAYLAGLFCARSFPLRRVARASLLCVRPRDKCGERTHHDAPRSAGGAGLFRRC